MGCDHCGHMHLRNTWTVECSPMAVRSPSQRHLLTECSASALMEWVVTIVIICTSQHSRNTWIYVRVKCFPMLAVWSLSQMPFSENCMWLHRWKPERNTRIAPPATTKLYWPHWPWLIWKVNTQHFFTLALRHDFMFSEVFAVIMIKTCDLVTVMWLMRFDARVDATMQWRYAL